MGYKNPTQYIWIFIYIKFKKGLKNPTSDNVFLKHMFLIANLRYTDKGYTCIGYYYTSLTNIL